MQGYKKQLLLTLGLWLFIQFFHIKNESFLPRAWNKLPYVTTWLVKSSFPWINT